MVLMKSSPKQTCLELSIQHCTAFAIEGRDERDDSSVDMMDRQDAHQSIVRSERMPTRDGVGVDQEVLGCEDHALGRASRSGGVDDQDVIVQPRRTRRDAQCSWTPLLQTACPVWVVFQEAFLIERDHMAECRKFRLK